MQAIVLTLLIMFQDGCTGGCSQPPMENPGFGYARQRVYAPVTYTTLRNLDYIQSRFDVIATLPSGNDAVIPIINGWVPQVVEKRFADGTVQLIFDFRSKLDYNDYKFKKIRYDILEDKYEVQRQTVPLKEAEVPVKERTYPPPMHVPTDKPQPEEVTKKRPPAQIIEERKTVPQSEDPKAQEAVRGVVPSREFWKPETPKSEREEVQLKKPSEITGEESSKGKKFPDYGKKD